MPPDPNPGRCPSDSTDASRIGDRQDSAARLVRQVSMAIHPTVRPMTLQICTSMFRRSYILRTVHTSTVHLSFCAHG